MPSHSLIILLSRLDSFPNPLYTRLMLARVYSCAVIGLEGVIVEVEVDTGEGLPSMVIVGSIDLIIVCGVNHPSISTLPSNDITTFKCNNSKSLRFS